MEEWGRVFFLANLASGSMALWDFFTDIQILDEPGLLVFRAGASVPGSVGNDSQRETAFR